RSWFAPKRTRSARSTGQEDRRSVPNDRRIMDRVARPWADRTGRVPVVAARRCPAGRGFGHRSRLEEDLQRTPCHLRQSMARQHDQLRSDRDSGQGGGVKYRTPLTVVATAVVIAACALVWYSLPQNTQIYA